MNKVLIRRAGVADAATVYSLLREFAVFQKREADFRLTGENVRDDMLKNMRLSVALATVEECVAGLVCWYPVYNSFSGESGLYLEDIFVRADFRRNGVGRELFRYLAAEAKRVGASHIDGLVLKHNVPAQNLYRKLGGNIDQTWQSFRLTGKAIDTLIGTK